jgi:hypothetical protein
MMVVSPKWRRSEAYIEIFFFIGQGFFMTDGKGMID